MTSDPWEDVGDKARVKVIYDHSDIHLMALGKNPPLTIFLVLVRMVMVKPLTKSLHSRGNYSPLDVGKSG
jgi:hypothetical protein